MFMHIHCFKILAIDLVTQCKCRNFVTVTTFYANANWVFSTRLNFIKHRSNFTNFIFDNVHIFSFICCDDMSSDERIANCLRKRKRVLLWPVFSTLVEFGEVRARTQDQCLFSSSSVSLSGKWTSVWSCLNLKHKPPWQMIHLCFKFQILKYTHVFLF